MSVYRCKICGQQKVWFHGSEIIGDGWEAIGTCDNCGRGRWRIVNEEEEEGDDDDEEGGAVSVSQNDD